MAAPNVLLVVLDAAQASRVYDETVMPNVTQLASGAATYTNAYTTAPWSLPSHASLFTGTHTSTHGVDADTPQFTPDRQPLAARFERRATGHWRTRTTSGSAPALGSTPGSTSLRSGGSCSAAAKGSPRLAKRKQVFVADSGSSRRSCSRETRRRRWRTFCFS